MKKQIKLTLLCTMLFTSANFINAETPTTFQGTTATSQTCNEPACRGSWAARIGTHVKNYRFAIGGAILLAVGVYAFVKWSQPSKEEAEPEIN